MMRQLPWLAKHAREMRRLPPTGCQKQAHAQSNGRSLPRLGKRNPNTTRIEKPNMMRTVGGFRL